MNHRQKSEFPFSTGANILTYITTFLATVYYMTSQRSDISTQSSKLHVLILERHLSQTFEPKPDACVINARDSTAIIAKQDCGRDRGAA
jgi:hypothetical protein